jgi:hypothetical protein
VRTRVRVGSTVETNGGVSKGKKHLNYFFFFFFFFFWVIMMEKIIERRRKRRKKSVTEWNRIDRL